ncbi:putative dehydrogenase [Microbacterium endophyticum]|uniref:Putative dehydrogenase n=1 Tax=Microbacterium endophyticum TaxID=1526412 RepID=A0A7W4V4D0_9MICO|nr:Gfo/Idh/MocA family oxidoreductase [Microbacterium endophyticum]MBB2976617.1 putative dehydrogenase [Microbacterium endophyticum]NIK37500.1 putative dehydrogenase [Microbacterium endophyticum]
MTDVPSGRRIGAGFIGGGFMAAVHSRAARAAGARLVAVASSSVERSREAAARLGIENGVDSAEGIAASPEISVVHVCTPNAQHVADTMTALGHRKHVICEKPLATTVPDAIAVANAASAAGVVGAVPFIYRYHPTVRHARALISAGEIGTVLTVDASYLQDWLLGSGETNWRVDAASGGQSRAFADIGSHLCDLIEFVTGSRIESLSARTRTVYDERGGQPVANEDIAAVIVELDSGALGTLLISQMAPGRKNALVFEIHGSQQSIRFAQERPEELWVGTRDSSRTLLRSPDALGDRELSLVPAGHPMGYQDAFNAFVSDAYAAIAGESPDGLPTFEDGVRAAHITAAVLDSARSGEWVTVAPSPPTDKQDKTPRSTS